MAKEITNEFTHGLKEKFSQSAKHQLAQHTVIKNGILASSENIKGTIDSTNVFSEDIKIGKVSNQKASGRCWMFAALNTFRHKILNNFQLKEFELSQSYTFFWDKYEKSNWFLEKILETANEELTSRKVAFLLQTPQQDGGQWDMIVSIFNKYGVVPQSVYPESAASSNSRELNTYLNKLLRKNAKILRDLVKNQATAEEITSTKEKMLEEIYNFLSITLGTPPETFNFEYRDDDQNYHIDFDLTPKSFYDKYVGVDLSNYISVINSPTSDKPYMKSYTVDLLGNVVGGIDVKYLNVEMETLKDLAIQQIKDGESVWFGCDVGQSSERQKGIMNLDVFDVNGLFEADFTSNKADRLDYGESLMTHAMVLTGVDIVKGKSTKWKVENSWGDKTGFKGIFVASDAWMDEYTYQVVIRKDFLTPEQLKAFEEAPTVLAPWDPMGALA